MKHEHSHECTSLLANSKRGRGILRVVSCKLRVRVEICELQVSVCKFNSTHTLEVEQCELRVSHICALNDFRFQCDLSASACVCV